MLPVRHHVLLFVAGETRCAHDHSSVDGVWLQKKLTGIHLGCPLPLLLNSRSNFSLCQAHELSRVSRGFCARLLCLLYGSFHIVRTLAATRVGWLNSSIEDHRGDAVGERVCVSSVLRHCVKHLLQQRLVGPMPDLMMHSKNSRGELSSVSSAFVSVHMCAQSEEPGPNLSVSSQKSKSPPSVSSPSGHAIRTPGDNAPTDSAWVVTITSGGFMSRFPRHESS